MRPITLQRSVLALFLLILGAPRASAQTTGTITGTITDEITSAPIPSPFPGAMYLVSALGVGATRGQNRTVGVDGTGQYTISDLPAGTYTLRVLFPPNHVSEIHDNIPCTGDDCMSGPPAGTPVTVTAGGTLIINFPVARGGAFSGTVRRASNGQPLSGVRIRVYNASTSFMTVVSTGSNGEYILTNLPAGSYFARVDGDDPVGHHVLPELYANLPCWTTGLASGDSCRIASGTPIVVADSATTTGIDFALDTAGGITGVVTAEDTAQPLAGVRVALYVGILRLGLATTNGSGAFSFGNLPPGPYQVRTDGPTANYVDEWFGNVCIGCPGTIATVTVASGATTSGINLSLAGGGSISGTVTCQILSPGDWFRTPNIFVYDAGGVLVRTHEAIGACSTGNTTVAYTVQGLRTGQYFLVARDPIAAPLGTAPHGGYFIDILYGGAPCVTVDCDPRRAIPVNVTAGATTAGVDFFMTQGASSTTLVIGAQPPLRLFDARGVELRSVVKPVGGLLPNWLFFVGVPPGTYYATFGERLHGRGWCASCPPTSGRPIVIRPGQRSFSFDFSGTAAGVTVSGTVRNEAGNVPLSTINVELYAGDGTLVDRSLTNIAGSYENHRHRRRHVLLEDAQPSRLRRRELC